MPMANANLFRSLVGRLLPATDAVNHEGAPAYAMEPRHALAQYAATGCLQHTFYASGGEQLAAVMRLCAEVSPEFVARAALYARHRGRMKDMPALLCALLASHDGVLLERVFARVIDDGRMLRSFVQIVRSGVTGRRSFGTRPRRLIRQWLAARGDEQILRAAVGRAPALADVIAMVHPKPASATRAALYAWILNRAHAVEHLPAAVRAFEAYKKGETDEVPDVPFQLLTALPLPTEAWRTIARRASWQTARMNLNTFVRHGVFAGEGGGELAEMLAERLRDRAAIRAAGALPYQLLAAYAAAHGELPAVIRDALHDAMEIAIENVPAFDGQVYVCPDVSGSMSSPVTGRRGSATTAVRCIDVAALVAAAVLRRNPTAEVLPFADTLMPVALDARDSIMINAARLAAIDGGGTNCSAPLTHLNKRGATGELVIIVSDNESWVDARQGRGTALMEKWERFRARNRQARLVCIDLQPNRTTQACERDDVLNVGGFSDDVFTVVAAFAAGRLSASHWVGEVEAMEI
jgi:60 kDa SS-A/Ro ribonucleoprotein